MASRFHSGNGAKLLQVNETTQNFEYKIIDNKDENDYKDVFIKNKIRLFSYTIPN